MHNKQSSHNVTLQYSNNNVNMQDVVISHVPMQKNYCRHNNVHSPSWQ